METNTSNGYWTEGKINASGTNIGGGQFVQGAKPINTTIDGGNLEKSSLIQVPKPSPYAIISPLSVSQPQGTVLDANSNAIIQPQQKQTTTEPQKSTYQKILDSIGLANTELNKKSEVSQQLNTEQDISGKTFKAMNSYNAYNKANIEYQTELQNRMNADQNKVGAVGGGFNAETERFKQLRSGQIANLAVQANMDAGNLKAAQEAVKSKLDSQFQPLQDNIDRLYQIATLTGNDPAIKLEAAKQESEMRETIKVATDLHQAVIDNGNPPGILAALDKVTQDYNSGKINATEARSRYYQAAGKYGGDMLKRSIDQVQYDNAVLQGQKLKNEVAAGLPPSGEYAPILSSISSLDLTADARKASVLGITSALASGNFTNAYANIANAVGNSLKGSAQTKFEDTRTDIGVMLGMRNAIKEYTDAGGDLGYLKGTADTIAKKFGQLATDPKFAALGVQLQREFQTYRLAMTGAAFSPAESREYASVNPRTNASLDLNLATIDGALAQLTNRVTSTINQRIPDAEKIYKLANPDKSTTPVTSGTLKSGVTFKVVN